ncbi:hypothetical protein ACFOEY_07920 [Paracandidimonas soli]
MTDTAFTGNWRLAAVADTGGASGKRNLPPIEGKCHAGNRVAPHALA